MSYNFYFFYYYFMSFINLYSPIAHPSPTPRPPIHPSRARTQTLRAHKQEETNVFGQKHDATGVEIKISWQNVITKSKRFTS